MNNATHEQPVHAVTLPYRDADEETPVTPQEGQPFRNEKNSLSEVLTRLDEIRYSPRVSTIKAIMDYSREKDKAHH